MSNTDEINPYALLEVNLESTEQKIRTAYRQRSLKVHPDRVRSRPPFKVPRSDHHHIGQNRNNPDAGMIS